MSALNETALRAKASERADKILHALSNTWAPASIPQQANIVRWLPIAAVAAALLIPSLRKRTVAALSDTVMRIAMQALR